MDSCTVCGLHKGHDYVFCESCAKVIHCACIDEDEVEGGGVWCCYGCRSEALQVVQPSAEDERAAQPSTSVLTHPASMTRCTNINITPRAELENWAREVRSSQGTPVQRTQATTDPVESVLARMEACFDSLVNKMAGTYASNATVASRLGHPNSTAYDFPHAVRNQPTGTSSTAHPGSPVNGSTAVHELSRCQMSARQAVPRELPPFSGRLEDWPTFLATYEETTNLCGFSPSENVLRLRQALSGRALKAVECRLRRAEDLKEALATLKEMYGRPEHLIDTLLAKIRRAPPLNEDRLDNLLDFAISVEEICATVRGSEAEHRFDGPVLRELVDLLPWHLKIDWGRHCVSRPAKTLGEFGMFMRQLKSALLHVVSPSPQPVERRAARHVSVHFTTDMTQKNAKPAAQCMCDGGCKTLVECWAYWQLEVSQRWNHVRANGHCRSCLKMHKGPCRDCKPCDRDGCTAKHHRSLHDSTRRPNQREPEAAALAERGGVPYPVPMERKSFNLHSTGTPGVLLRYVPVTVYGHGKSVTVLAFLDEGSSVTLMEHKLMEELGLKGSPKPLCLSWTGGHTREEESSAELSITVSGSENAGRRYELSAVRTVRSLGLPPQAIDEREIAARYQHLSTVPVKSYQWQSPRLLIGIDNYRLSCPLKTVEGAPHEPVATKTRIGWVIAGVCASQIGGSKRAILGVHALPCSCHHHQQTNYQQETGGGSPNVSSYVGAHRAAQAGGWFASGIGGTTARHKPSNLKPEEKEKRRIRRRRKMQVAAQEQTVAEALEQEQQHRHRGPIGENMQQPNELSVSLDDIPLTPHRSPVEQLAEAKLLVAPDDSASAIWNVRKRMKRNQPVLTLPKKTWLSSSITTDPADAGQKCSRDSAKHSSDRLSSYSSNHNSVDLAVTRGPVLLDRCHNRSSNGSMR